MNSRLGQAAANRVSLTYGQISVVVSLVSVTGFCLFVRYFLKDTVQAPFAQLSKRSCSSLLTYPSVSLLVLFISIYTNTIFSLGPWQSGG